MLSKQIKTNNSLPHSLYCGQQIKDFEGQAAVLASTTLYELMTRAGEACYGVFKNHFSDAKQLLVLVGKGNNGGDGYIFATMAKEAGLSVQLCQMGHSTALTGNAAQASRAWEKQHGVIEGIEQADFTRADVIIDALLGTGLSGNVSPEYQSLINKINQSAKRVLSIDIPSGLNADTGAVSNVVVKADVTVCFVGLKQGLFTGRGCDYCGQIYFSGLGIEEQFTALSTSRVTRISYSDLAYLLTPRNRCSHKGSFGKTLIIGGNLGMTGAVRLAGEAALRTGSGLVKILTREESRFALLAGCPELMVNAFDLQKKDNRVLYNWATNLVIGPGLGQDDWAKFLFDLILGSDLATVIDADGLTLLADNPHCKKNWILTPHPGEASKLLGCSVEQVEENRFTAVRNLQQRFGGVVILKGAGTLICDGRQIYLANVGNPGMASGGMGDVLSGIIGGLLAQGLNLQQAATFAVCIHGLAGDLAAGQEERGLLASDLFPYIRKLVNPSC
ncbi:NAD(P)H-hydrate dehydratase [Psychromonas antarctica]|uniref:NAD(P)H-hydrate dehydratase n=1 Tax=Psychromonas antarctica TaxID=67573 RepID=UPI001EE7F770|nr:NAD(P)H-hydrate dehydratase [Psychromonas antarctica]MCG6201115.1 NAD(P)H-hydrate dehydratase [Psychromonas antarctica]